MNRIFGPIMESVPKEVVFQVGALVISKPMNKLRELYLSGIRYFFTS